MLIMGKEREGHVFTPVAKASCNIAALVDLPHDKETLIVYTDASRDVADDWYVITMGAEDTPCGCHRVVGEGPSLDALLSQSYLGFFWVDGEPEWTWTSPGLAGEGFQSYLANKTS